jgi:hypothetical protein
MYLIAWGGGGGNNYVHLSTIQLAVGRKDLEHATKKGEENFFVIVRSGSISPTR